MAGILDTCDDSYSQHNDRAYRDPVRWDVHQVSGINQTGDYDRKTRGVDSE